MTWTIPCIPNHSYLLENVSLQHFVLQFSVEPGKAAGDNHCEADDDGEDRTNCTIRCGLTFLGVPHLSSNRKIRSFLHQKGQYLYLLFIYIFDASVFIYIYVYRYVCMYVCIYIYIQHTILYIYVLYIYVRVSMYPDYQLKIIRIESESWVSMSVWQKEVCLWPSKNHSGWNGWI